MYDNTTTMFMKALHGHEFLFTSLKINNQDLFGEDTMEEKTQDWCMMLTNLDAYMKANEHRSIFLTVKMLNSKWFKDHKI